MHIYTGEGLLNFFYLLFYYLVFLKTPNDDFGDDFGARAVLHRKSSDDDFGARAVLLYCCFTAALLLLLLKTGEGFGGFDDNIGTRVLFFILFFSV